MTAASRLLALGAGAACYALALPPFDIWPLAWVALVPLLDIAGAASPRAAFGWGAAAGFVTSWTVTWWLAQAISSYFAANIALGAAATCAAYVLAVSSTFGAFAWLVATAGRVLPRPARSFAAAALWVGCEFVRARVLADPWALLGYTQYRVVPLIQIASLTGVYGVSFVVALGNAALAEMTAAGGSVGERLRAVLAPLATVLAVALAGAGTLHGATPPARALPAAIVQTNVPPAYRWDRRYAERQLAAALRLTNEALRDDPGLVVWPENALSLYLDQEPLLLASLRELARERGTDLVLGGPRHAEGRTYNSAYVLDGRDGSLHVYDKQRLVPAAEAPIVPVGPTERDESPRSFTPGRLAGLVRARTALGVSICHEILYPETVHPAVADGAEVLVNIANDGWLDGGYGVASRQHFAMAVLRAVEARRYLVRAATTGVSGIVDPWGRVLAASAPGVAGVITAPVDARRGTTPYVRFGDWFAVACLLCVPALALAARRPAHRSSRVAVPAPTTG
ncbi:MAG TPA: apolipoprotein N-acyltransferase [Candidatus Limnocylindria bacterium]|nr:apolipoprotein N-acyltransferase [Candidatus Limnocylindria bacterium]